MLFLLLVVAALAVSGRWVFRAAFEAAAQWEITRPDFTTGAQPEPPAVLQAPAISTTQAAEAAPLPPTASEEWAPWTGNTRITMLLLGIDQRCDESGPTRTDSMMLATFDPIGRSAAILSLPRDLWVEIPNFGLDRINQAHYIGESFDYPGGGGPALAAETVATTLGIDVDYFVTINFDAFVEVVDLIGGIDIEVPEGIDDPTYPDRCYGFDPFQIPAGSHHMDGATALKYARTRATFGGDVDRAARQQQVVLAVRDQVLDLGQVSQWMARSSELWQTFQENIRTNLTLEEAIQLALLLQEIPRESIHSAVIDYDYVYDQTTPDGQQVLVPIRDNIRALRDDLFAPPVRPTPELADLPEQMVREGARVMVYNGTGTFGLAGDTRDFLRSYDVNVVDIGNADDNNYPTTQVIVYGDFPQTTRFLTQLMSIPPLNVRSGTTPDGDFDVLIILGNDWAVPAQ